MDDRIETHPDLMNPDWQKYAEKDAWLGAKKDRKQFKKQQKRARSPRNGKRWGLVAFFAVLAVTTAVIVYLGRTPRSDNADTPSTPAPTTVNPTSVAQYAPVDLKHAYARTPADVWKKGIDGITSPAPAAIGAFKADAVADAYAKVKGVIAAGRLDPAVLIQHDTKAFLALFAKDVQGSIGEDLARKAKIGDDQADFANYVTEVATGYQLLDQGPRTLGSLSAHPGEKPGELVVDTKYVVAYAFDSPNAAGLTGPSEIVSFVRVDESYVVRSGRGFATTSHGLWPGAGGGSFYESIGCAALEEGYLAPAYSNRPGPGSPAAATRTSPGPSTRTCPARPKTPATRSSRQGP